jgi:RNase P subunit RPR2
MDIYLLAFLLIVLIGSVLVSIYYLKEKKEELDSIRRGYCPKCKQNAVVMTDQRSAGCSSPKIVSFECIHCGYTNSFSVNRSDSVCGNGGCR